jgi:hypothetical protein
MPTQAVITQRAPHIRSHAVFEARLALSMQPGNYRSSAKRDLLFRHASGA